MKNDETIPNRIKKPSNYLRSLFNKEHAEILEQLMQSELLCTEALGEYRKSRRDLLQIKNQVDELYIHYKDGNISNQLEKHHEILSMLLTLTLMRKNAEFDERILHEKIVKLLSSVKQGINIKNLQNKDIDGNVTIQEV